MVRRLRIRRDSADHGGQVRGLLVGQPGRGLVEQDQPRLAGHRARDLDQPSLARRRACRPAPAATGRRRRTRSRRARRRAARRRAATRTASPRCRRPSAPRWPARSGTCGAPPSGRGGSAASLSRSSPKARTVPDAGPDESGQHVEERGLARAVRPDEAAGALLERQVHVVERGDAAVPDGQVGDLDHAARPLRRRGPDDDAGRPTSLLIRPPQFLHVLRELVGDARRRGGQHLQHADAEQDREPRRTTRPGPAGRRAAAA